jgi:3,4-dihydroxy 2-butanone 4-phosphate synthase/GTP cyclohydrolase II
MSKLGEWLEATNTKRSAFAAAIGVSPAYVTLLCSDAPAWPGREVAAKIREATGGAVTADDFLPPIEPAEAEAPGATA